MTINITVPRAEPDTKPRITVVGIGGAGGNAVNNMIKSSLDGVEFLVMNTDAQALSMTSASRVIQLGRTITQGLGAGSRPDVGRAAAEEAMDEILEALQGSHMCFITAGMGGGTGTGAAPVVARAARDAGILTVGVVTKPFHFEGSHRMRLAEQGIEELTQYVDTLIVIPNQNLFRVATERTTFAEAFAMADDVLYSGVRGITDLMIMPGLINLDFADIRSIMSEMGKAMMGTGEATGERRAIEGAEAAISNPLLDEVSMKGARGVLINITGGTDMTLFEVDEAANRIRDEVDPDANIIFGSIFDPSLEGVMRITVVSTGIDAAASIQPKPRTLTLVENERREVAPQAAAPASAPAMPVSAPAMTARSTAMPSFAASRPAITAHSPAPIAATAKASPQVSYADAALRASSEVKPTASTQPVIAGNLALDLDTHQDHDVAVQHQQQNEAEPVVRAAQDEPFIAPAPVEAAPSREAPQSQAPRSAEPTFATRVMMPERARSPSLFERVTGTGRARPPIPSQGPSHQTAAAPAHDTAVAAPSTQSAVRTEASEPNTALNLSASYETSMALEPTIAEPLTATPTLTATPGTRPESARQPLSTPAGHQPRLGGLSAVDRPVEKSIDDDLLDIPAFLRRQAN